MTPAARAPRTPATRGGLTRAGAVHRRAEHAIEGGVRQMRAHTATDGRIPTLQKRTLHDADPRLAPLSAAQRRVVLALLDPDERAASRSPIGPWRSGWASTSAR